MRPFSALYYIRQNKARSLVLMFMISACTLCYFCGIYIYSTEDFNEKTLMAYKDYAILSPGYGCTQEHYDDTITALKELESSDDILPIQRVTRLRTINELNIYNSKAILTFQSKEDFTTFSTVSGSIPTDTIIPSNGELILSEPWAKNLGISVGDVLDSKSSLTENFDRSYTVVAIYPWDGYAAYSVNESFESNDLLITRCSNQSIEKDQEAFATDLHSFLDDTYISITNYETYCANNEKYTATFDLIYCIIVLLLTIVLAVTINATFIGAYEKRKFEFSVYEAIGFHKRQLILKMIKEILWFDLTGLIFGSLVVFLLIGLLNIGYFEPMGLHLPYFHVKALFFTILCNLLFMVPITFMRIRAAFRLSITEY